MQVHIHTHVHVAIQCHGVNVYACTRCVMVVGGYGGGLKIKLVLHSQ